MDNADKSEFIPPGPVTFNCDLETHGVHASLAALAIDDVQAALKRDYALKSQEYQERSQPGDSYRNRQRDADRLRQKGQEAVSALIGYLTGDALETWCRKSSFRKNPGDAGRTDWGRIWPSWKEAFPCFCCAQ
jgi:hypothetical protein